jgi:hypothetical protein
MRPVNPVEAAGDEFYLNTASKISHLLPLRALQSIPPAVSAKLIW